MYQLVSILQVNLEKEWKEESEERRRKNGCLQALALSV